MRLQRKAHCLPLCIGVRAESPIDWFIIGARPLARSMSILPDGIEPDTSRRAHRGGETFSDDSGRHGSHWRSMAPRTSRTIFNAALGGEE
jgi:hypothetical protein